MVLYVNLLEIVEDRAKLYSTFRLIEVPEIEEPVSFTMRRGVY